MKRLSPSCWLLTAPMASSTVSECLSIDSILNPVIQHELFLFINFFLSDWAVVLRTLCRYSIECSTRKRWWECNFVVTGGGMF